MAPAGEGCWALPTSKPTLVRAVAVMMANAIRLATGISLQERFLRTSRKPGSGLRPSLEKRRREQAAILGPKKPAASYIF